LETGQQPLVLSSETVLEAVVVLAAALEVRKELPEVQAAELRKSGRMRRRSHWARKLEHLYSAKKVLKIVESLIKFGTLTFSVYQSQ
jgi:coenzyme F420-reducing hydrogenase alpha subunit